MVLEKNTGIIKFNQIIFQSHAPRLYPSKIDIIRIFRIIKKLVFHLDSISNAIKLFFFQIYVFKLYGKFFRNHVSYQCYPKKSLCMRSLSWKKWQRYYPKEKRVINRKLRNISNSHLINNRWFLPNLLMIITHISSNNSILSVSN